MPCTSSRPSFFSSWNSSGTAIGKTPSCSAELSSLVCYGLLVGWSGGWEGWLVGYHTTELLSQVLFPFRIFRAASNPSRPLAQLQNPSPKSKTHRRRLSMVPNPADWGVVCAIRLVLFVTISATKRKRLPRKRRSWGMARGAMFFGWCCLGFSIAFFWFLGISKGLFWKGCPSWFCRVIL